MSKNTNYTSLTERAFYEYVQDNPEGRKQGFLQYLEEHYYDDLKDCFRDILYEALSLRYGQLTRRKKAPVEGQSDLFGWFPPEQLTIPDPSEESEYIHKNFIDCTLSETADHARIRKEHAIAVLQEVEAIESAILQALEVSNGDHSWTWRDILDASDRSSQ